VQPKHLTPLQQVRHALNERYIERAYEVQLLLVAAVSKSHTFFLGPPGTGKTDLTQDFAKCVGGTVFDTLVSAGTSRDELEGPMNTKILTEEGRQVRLRQGYMSEATFAVVDEIWKSSPFLLNSMLRLMSQRTYFEDGQEHAAKTRCVLAASNETPQDKSLEALYSRFSLRCYCDSIVGDLGLAQLLGIVEWNRPDLPQSVIGSLTEADLDAERQKALALPLTKAFGKVWLQCLKALSTLRTGPRTLGIRIDDRRLRNLMEIAKVWAHLDGKKSVGPEYALILADTAWNTPGERQLVEAEIYSRASVSDVVSDALALGDQIMQARTESLMGNGKGPVVEAAPVPVQGNPNGTIEALVADRVRKAAVKASKEAS
jgi:MoxR-like ATPase